MSRQEKDKKMNSTSAGNEDYIGRNKPFGKKERTNED